MRIRALSLDLVFHDSSELSAALVRELCDSCDRSANGVGARRFPTDLDGRPETFAAGNRGWCRFVDCSRLGLLLQFAGGIEGILLFMMGFVTLLWDYSRVFVRSWSGELTS